MMKKTFLVLSTLSLTLLAAPSGAELAEKYGCTACHAIASKKEAPPFRGIANRNRRFYGSEAKAHIMQSIQKGSKGQYRRFGDKEMPPFPNLTLAELNTLADWILVQGGRGGGHGRGMGRGGGMGRGMGF